MEVILYGPDSEAYNVYAAASPAPPAIPGVGGPGAAGGMMAVRGIRPMGSQLVLQDGRKFRFGIAGGSTLVIGNLLSAGVATASQQNLTAAAAAVLDRILTMTTGAATAANVFAEGYANISVTPGLNDTYKIGGHLLMTGGAGDIVNLAPGNAVRRVLSTASKIDLIDNPYSRVIQIPATTVASVSVGVAVAAALTLQGTWLQTRGACGVLTSGTAIAGDVVGPGLGTAGAVGPIAALATQPPIGWCIFAAASGAGSTIYLTIDG